MQGRKSTPHDHCVKTNLPIEFTEQADGVPDSQFALARPAETLRFRQSDPLDLIEPSQRPALGAPRTQ